MSEKTKQNVIKGETKRGNLISRKVGKRLSQTKSKNSPVEQVLHLQRTLGNRAVAWLIKSGAIQGKLTIGKPNDIYEKEADSVADRVMNMPEESVVSSHSSLGRKAEEYAQMKPLAEQITPLVQRQVEEEEEVQSKIQRQATEEEEEPVQAKAVQRQESEEEKEAQTKLQRQAEEEEETAQTKAVPNNTPKVTSNIEYNINSMKEGGQPLSQSTRSFFEPRFGTNFSQVRVHTDDKAGKIARSINAKAFTTGKDIVFNSGQYSPGTSSGKRLLAHELTHVLQQNNRFPKNIQRTNGGGAACNPCPTPPNHQVQVRIYVRWRYANLGVGHFGSTEWGSSNVTFVSIWHRERRNCKFCGAGGTTPEWDLCPRSAVVLGTVPIAINRNEVNKRGPNGERWYRDASNVFDTQFITPADAAATMTAPYRITLRNDRRHEMYHVGVSERLLRERLEARNDIHSICPYSSSAINTWKTSLETTWKTDSQTFLRSNPNEPNEELNARNQENSP